MKHSIRSLAATLVVLAGLTMSIGCTAAGSIPVGPLRTENVTEQLGAAKSVSAKVTMGAGELNVAGGASQLLEATFEYNVDAWKPQVSYSVNGSQGALAITQPSTTGTPSGDVRYTWDLKLNNQVPLDLSTTLGAGRSTLDLSRLNLTALAVKCGAGEATVDLSGAWKQNVSGTISAGVGRLTLLLPRDTGVQVNVTHGLGSVTATGLSQNGNAYSNEAFGQSSTTLLLSVQGGVGEVNLRVVQ
jgi:hypothetical protein